jgi:hypothetical protein
LFRKQNKIKYFNCEGFRALECTQPSPYTWAIKRGSALVKKCIKATPYPPKFYPSPKAVPEVIDVVTNGVAITWLSDCYPTLLHITPSLVLN